jgi:hypothetical protein
LFEYPAESFGIAAGIVDRIVRVHSFSAFLPSGRVQRHQELTPFRHEELSPSWFEVEELGFAEAAVLKRPLRRFSRSR